MQHLATFREIAARQRQAQFVGYPITDRIGMADTLALDDLKSK